MEHWQFAPSSLDLLEQCISAPADSPRFNQPAKKWIALFKPSKSVSEIKVQVKKEYNSSNTSLDIEVGGNDTFNGLPSSPRSPEAPNRVDQETRSRELLERIRRDLKTAPNKLDYLIGACETNDSALPILAENLTKMTAEVALDGLFNRTDINVRFVNDFFRQFLPVYIKKEPLSYASDLLIKSYKTHPEQLKTLMETLLMDTEINSKLLEEFFRVNSGDCLQFLQALAVRDIPKESFIHHMNTISFLYKNSQNTSEIHNFVLDCLLKSAEDCKVDKNYGRFMLTFFQAVKEGNVPINKSLLVTLVQTHTTPFKKPCSTILSSLKSNT